MYRPLALLLERLQAMPIDIEESTSFYGSATVSRSQLNPIRTTLSAPIVMQVCRFNRDNTEYSWRMHHQKLTAFRYHGALPYHTQAGIAFQCVLQGQISKMIMGQTITMKAGDCCLIDMNCVHAELADLSDAILFCMEMRPDFFSQDLLEGDNMFNLFFRNALEDKDHNRYLILRESQNLDALHASINWLLTFECTPGDGQLNLHRGMVQQMFSHLSSDSEPELHSSDSSPRQDMVFFELDRYVRGHLATVSVQALSELFHYDRNYFNRLIRAKTGLTYTQYLRQVRIDEAKRLLRETSLSVQDICQRIGYENRSFFYRIFQEETGQAPLEYRQQPQ